MSGWSDVPAVLSRQSTATTVVKALIDTEHSLVSTDESTGRTQQPICA